MVSGKRSQALSRLREHRREQESALAAALRAAEGVGAARDRQRRLIVQGRRLVELAEQQFAARFAELTTALGSARAAAAVLELDETGLRKARTARRAARDGARRPTTRTTPTPRPRAVDGEGTAT